MIKMRSKIISGCLALLMTAGMLCSCGMLGKPSDSEIRTAMEEILPAAYEATYIVYGPGLEIEEGFEIDPSWTVSHYAPVSEKSKYKSEKEIKALILSAFSKDYALEMYEYAFEGNEELMSRYGTNSGRLTKDVTKKAFAMAEEVYTDSARVTKGTAYACIVEMEYKAEGIEDRLTMKVRMVKEEEKWLFDGPVY